MHQDKPGRSDALRYLDADGKASRILVEQGWMAHLNADTIMPAYYALDGLNRVAPAYRGKPILTAEQIEDVVAYLATLRD